MTPLLGASLLLWLAGGLAIRAMLRRSVSLGLLAGLEHPGCEALARERLESRIPELLRFGLASGDADRLAATARGRALLASASLLDRLRGRPR